MFAGTFSSPRECLQALSSDREKVQFFGEKNESVCKVFIIYNILIS